MSGSRLPYIGRPVPRQSRTALPAIASACIALSLAGCARMMPIDAGPATTGSIKIRATATDGVDPSDWAAIRRALAAHRSSSESLEFAWQNSMTGSAGTIAASASAGACSSIAVTVNDMRGARRYRGEACRSGTGVTLRGIVPDDQMLL